LALQLSAMSQVPIDEGGLGGAVAYITTGSASLPTNRLLEMARLHPKTAKLDMASLMDNIHYCRAPTVYALTQVLNHNLPSLCDQLVSEDRFPPRKPIRLLIIDSITTIFQTGEKTTTTTLVERSKAITEVSTILHHLASQRGLTILVLNHVTDVFQDQEGFYASGGQGQEAEDTREILYRDQSKWFNRGFDDGKKEATLGLTWANQVNTRVMLSRTGRRRLLENDESTTVTVKRRKGVDGTQIPTRSVHFADSRVEDEDEDFSSRGTLIRRFSLIFSPSAPPAATDFIVLASGVQAFDSSQFPSTQSRHIVPASTPLPTFVPGLTQLVRNGPSQNAHVAPVQSNPQALQRAPSIDELSAFDEEEWIAIAEKSEIWDAPEPEVGDLPDLPSEDTLNMDESGGDAGEFVPSSQAEELERISFDYPSNVVTPSDLISLPV
jgi:DNA repair protein RAD57